MEFVNASYQLTPPLSPMAFCLLALFQTDGLAVDKVRMAFSAVAPTQGVLWVAVVGGLFT